MDYNIIEYKNSKYPKRLKELKDCPKVLYTMGNVDLLNKTSIAIVGARDCNEYGKEQTKRFASYLAQKDICIVSGLARGIDSIAHIHSMEKMGKTIAVIASGFNHIYPKENFKLYENILENGGLIISEWEPDTEVNLHMFPRRNRIISGLSIATLVIQARYRSGSNITAHYAMKQRKTVFSIPGNIDDTRSHGTNRLIRDGASLVISPTDILEELEYDGFYYNKEIKVKSEYQDIYNQIGVIPISGDEISRKLKQPINKINEELLMLEIDGFIEEKGVGKYVIKTN